MGVDSKTMLRFRVISFPLLSCLGALFLGGVSAAGEKFSLSAVPVAELFTSQGCSACPAADQLLSELADRTDVLALTWAVDYWDYMGWTDTLARPENTGRQKAYNEAMGRSGVYTPQMIIDGRHQMVGSRRDEVEGHLTRALSDAARPKLRITYPDDGPPSLSVASAAAIPATAMLYLVIADNTVTLDIEGGENQGKTVTYHHVVRHAEALPAVEGKTLTATVPPQAFDPEHQFCAAMLQDGESGPILAAAILPKGC